MGNITGKGTQIKSEAISRGEGSTEGQGFALFFSFAFATARL